MSPTQVIPKKDLTDFQRWQLDSLDTAKTQDTHESNQGDTAAHDTEAPHNPAPETPKPTELPSQEQINHVLQQAQQDGYAAGFQLGRNAGYQEAKQQAQAEIKNEINRIQAILSELNQELQQVDQQVAEELLSLAVHLAKKMITEALKIRPELILPIVQEAIRQLPHAAQHPRLFLHPEDALLVSKHLTEELSQSEWKICQDENIIRGGCRIEASGSEVDASLSTRWQRILATIGQENNWLE